MSRELDDEDRCYREPRYAWGSDSRGAPVTECNDWPICPICGERLDDNTCPDCAALAETLS